jgi:hypothetical protein
MKQSRLHDVFFIAAQQGSNQQRDKQARIEKPCHSRKLCAFIDSRSFAPTSHEDGGNSYQR